MDSKLDEEVRMMKIIPQRSRVLSGENIHMKYLSTPFCVLSGSLNLSFSGIHGRNQENTHLTFEGNRDYPTIIQGINRIIQQSRSYDEEGTGTLVEWETPDVELFVQELDGEIIEHEENTMMPEFEEAIDEEGFQITFQSKLLMGATFKTELRKSIFNEVYPNPATNWKGGFCYQLIKKSVKSGFQNSNNRLFLTRDENVKEVLPSLLGITAIFVKMRP